MLAVLHQLWCRVFFNDRSFALWLTVYSRARSRWLCFAVLEVYSRAAAEGGCRRAWWSAPAARLVLGGARGQKLQSRAGNDSGTGPFDGAALSTAQKRTDNKNTAGYER